MTAPAKTVKPVAKTPIVTVAKATAPAKNDKPAKPTFDFGAMSFETTPTPKRAPGAGRKPSYTPHPALVAAINASWADRKVLREYKEQGVVVRTTYIGSGRSTNVPKAGVDAFKSAVRKVADHLGFGLSFGADEERPGGMVRVTFATKTRSDRTRKS